MAQRLTLSGLLIVVIAAAVGCGPDLQRSEHVIERALTPRVVTVMDPRTVDGDTLATEELGRVRLIGIDCPEVGEPGADDATRYTAAMVRGNTVHLAISPLWPLDVYGRCRAVAYVTGTGGPLCINADLVRRGLARPSSWGPEAFDVAAWAQERGPGPTRSRLVDARLPDPSRIVVYVSPSGAKYHRKDCHHARNGMPTTLRSAVARGYGPCGACYPPVMNP